MHIDEFIDQYSQAEVEKVVRNDPIQRFHDKLQTQAISMDYAVNAIEAISVRSPQRGSSPMSKSMAMNTGRRIQRRQMSASKS